MDFFHQANECFFLYTVGVFFERHVFVFIGNIKFDEKCPVDIQAPKMNQQYSSEADWIQCDGIIHRPLPKVGSMSFATLPILRYTFHKNTCF